MINIFHFVIKRYFYLQKTDIGIQLNTNKAVYIYIILVFTHKKRATYWLLFLILIDTLLLFRTEWLNHRFITFKEWTFHQINTVWNRREYCI